MNVLLISANTLTTPYPVYPLGLDAIAGALAPRHNVQIADMNVIHDQAALAALINTFAPHIIGLSLRNVDNTDAAAPQGFMDQYQAIIDVVRGCSQSPIVLGGSGFTLFPREMMRALKADYGIMGEGERLALLVDAIQARTNIDAIPGVLRQTSSPSFPPPWEKPLKPRFDPHAGHLDFYLRRGGMLNLQTKRGCPFRCVYCTYPHIEGRRIRRFSPESVAAAAVNLQAAGAKYLFIVDAVFNSDYEHGLAVARAFRKAGLSIPWGAFFAPTRPPPDYYKHLAEAGLTHVEFGTEALCDKMLVALGKPFRKKHVFTAHECAREAGLYTAHYFLMGGPEENAESLDETLKEIENLDHSVFFFFCGVRIYPGTALRETAFKQDLITEEQNLVDPVFYQSPGVSEPEIVQRVQTRANGRLNWVIGAGGEGMAKIMARMYARGFTGPLWEHLIS